MALFIQETDNSSVRTIRLVIRHTERSSYNLSKVIKKKQISLKYKTD